MVFQQTAAPSGWTKQSTHDDKMMRVVSGTAGSGGTNPFSTVFGQTATGSHALTETESAGHNHQPSNLAAFRTNTGSVAVGGPTATTMATSGATDVDGSNGGHTHTMDMRVQYVDFIIASKN